MGGMSGRFLTAAQQHGRAMRARGIDYRGGYTREELKQKKEDNERRQEMTEKVVCNKCGAEFADQESIDLAKKWIADGYAPCPNMSCPGQLEIKEEV